MKVIFDKDTLLNALMPAASISPSHNTVTSIEGILFECLNIDSGKCKLTSYDMEKGFRTYIDAKIVDEGSAIINAQNILQIVKSMPSGEVMINVDEKYHVTITGGSSSFEIGAIPGENFPSLPLLAGEKNYTMSQYVFKELVRKTIFSVSQSEQRVVFSGLYFNFENNCCTVVGCDNNRLSIAKTEFDEEVPEAEVIVPGKILLEIMRMVKDTDEDITISISSKHIIFKIDEYIYFSRLIDGEYLNYQRILPQNSEKTIYINNSAFRSALERASLITEDKFGGNQKSYVKLNFAENLLKMSSNSTQGSIYEELNIEYTGEETTIAFKCKYLLDALKASDDVEEIRIGMNGPLTGITLEKSERDTDDKTKSKVSFKFFILPVRVK